jgi:hypothetical protein
LQVGDKAECAVDQAFALVLFVLRGLIHHDAVADAESDRAVRSVELHLFPRLSGLEVRGFVNDIGGDRSRLIQITRSMLEENEAAVSGNDCSCFT